MFTYPKISIVTPSFNQGKYIEQSILSVLTQNYPNLEYIILDAGSTDNTLEIISKYSNKITYWISGNDNGQSEAINKGLNICTGEIFNWLNSDDHLEKDSLFLIAKKFAENKKLELLCGYSNIYHENNPSLQYKRRASIYDNTETTIFNEKIIQPSMFYKTSCIKDIGGLNETLNFVMDLELWFRFLSKYGIKNILLTDNVFANFRIHPTSKTSQSDNEFLQEKKQIFYHLFKELDIPKQFYQYHTSSNSNYKPTNWYIKNLRKDNFILCLSDKYLFEFYKNNQLSTARIAYKKLIMNGMIKLTKSYFSLFVNLFIKGKKIH